LVETYNTRRLATFLAKNVGSSMFGKQLLTNFPTIFVIFVPDVATIEKLVEVHTNTIKGRIL
jgi:hypothetical protein